LGLLVGLCLLLFADVAAAQEAEPQEPAAQGIIIDVSAPEEALLGEPVEITASLRNAADGTPVVGEVVVFLADATFSGVSGELELGRATTNTIGVATLTREFTTTRIHNLRVVHDEVGSVPESASLEVMVTGEQLFSSEAGVSIPGVGGWVVVVVIGTVWGVMIGAAFWVVALSRAKEWEPATSPSGDAYAAESAAPEEEPIFNLAIAVTATMVVVAVGLVVLLIRSPDTHSNLNPEGYDRTPVAYVEASYLYPGLGAATLTGDPASDGQVLFVSAGCAGCHGIDAEGTTAASSPAGVTRDWLGQVVRAGLGGVMPSFSVGELSDGDLDSIHAFLDLAATRLPDSESEGNATAVTTTTVELAAEDSDAGSNGGASPTFSSDVLPIFEASCTGCHGGAGGWTATDYESVLNTGEHAPTVVAGSVDDSLLAAKVTGTQTVGSQMPPAQLLPEDQIAIITDWIAGGTPE
jgi:mono/diheme cytochrome c family protein